jgi:uncharacterized protein
VLDRNLLLRQATAEGVQAAIVERDYVLAHVVESLGRHRRADALVFKGGTALRLCFVADYRYSADLDLSLVGISSTEAIEAMTEILAAAKDRCGLVSLELESDPLLRIAYEGPLGRRRQVKLDLVDDELVEQTQRAPVLQRYDDQAGNVSCRTYTLEEMAAEKLRCVMQRVQCRDFYDLHHLFEEQQIEAAEVWPLFERKARHRSLDPSALNDSLEDRIERYRQRWDTELADYLSGPVPPFRTIERVVRRHLRQRA